MAESIVLLGLISKRAELSGLIDRYRKQINQLELEIACLDTTIELFSPGYDTQSIKPKRYRRKNTFFKVGESGKEIFDVLRKAGKPLNTSEIAKIIMNEKGFDQVFEKPLKATVLTTLRNYHKKGMVEVIGRDRNTSCIWALVP
ncbi:hypothetical protein [Nitrosomonas communis]|uniref:HTH HARE-type domain-containing protein n=1 Tax=Nitrosomonas communis TaxID=44574 RepID=A0A1H2RAX7_9PROT|nr:hypothetical protein [Nitrosomonas communis]SDW16531.1 hypothetical protein SAMN05421882_100446 [Nitrosomonas communis]